MAITERRLTLEEFLELPEESPALELVDGVVSQKVAPQWLHGRLQYATAAVINGFAEPRKLAMAFPEIREAHGRDSLVPDVGIYRWARIPRTAAGRLTNARPSPPDIAIEIISPGQTLAELIEKGRRYLAHGVQIVVIISPGPETVTLMRADGSLTTLRADDRIDLDTVLPGLELTVRALFDTLQLD
jgi:Uma2 family endonuclease